jgi:hypothetical protein
MHGNLDDSLHEFSEYVAEHGLTEASVHIELEKEAMIYLEQQYWNFKKKFLGLMGLQTHFWIHPNETISYNLVEQILKLQLPFFSNSSFSSFLRLRRYSCPAMRLTWAIRPWHQMSQHNIIKIFSKACQRSRLMQTLKMKQRSSQ